jgi:hypothetical protein
MIVKVKKNTGTCGMALNAKREIHDASSYAKKTVHSLSGNYTSLIIRWFEQPSNLLFILAHIYMTD